MKADKWKVSEWYRWSRPLAQTEYGSANTDVNAYFVAHHQEKASTFDFQISVTTSLPDRRVQEQSPQLRWNLRKKKKYLQKISWKT